MFNSRTGDARRRMAFWGGLILASIVALQLLARALSEFSLPEVAHPCLLFDDRHTKALRQRLQTEPWKKLWEQVKALAEKEPQKHNWLETSLVARANALVYAVDGQAKCSEKAARLLLRFPTPLYASRLKCEGLAQVAIYRAQTLDMLYGYLQRHHRLAAARTAVGRIARRLYYADTLRGRVPVVARLWRAAGLVSCALALADWEPPAELLSPQTLYAQGRAELRGAIRAAFGPAVVTQPDLLAEVFEALVPVALAIERTDGDNPLDREEVLRAARWALTAALPNGLRLSPCGKTAAFPSYLLTSARIYAETFAADFARSFASRETAAKKPVEAFCFFKPVEQYQLAERAGAVAVGPAFVLRAGRGENGIVLVSGVPKIYQSGRVVLVPVAMWHANEVAQMALRVELAACPKSAVRFIDFGRRRWFGQNDVIQAEAGAAERAFATAKWHMDSPAAEIEIRWVAFSAPGVLIWGHEIESGQKEGGVKVQLQMSPSQWAIAELGTEKPARMCLLTRWTNGSENGLRRRFMLSLVPRRMKWHLFGPTGSGWHYVLRGPAQSATWHLAVGDGLKVAGLGGNQVGGVGVSLLWRESQGRVREALIIDGQQLSIEGQVMWQSEQPQTAYWIAQPTRLAGAR